LRNDNAYLIWSTLFVELTPPQFSSEDLLVLPNVGMDIEDVHMQRDFDFL
jgi:hypothetical protein